MEFLSIFDMLKIGVGPSSSHTLGPWRASQKFIIELSNLNLISEVSRIRIELFGSLSLTGKGHATDIAVVLGLLNEDPETIKTDTITVLIENIKNSVNENSQQNKELPNHLVKMLTLFYTSPNTEHIFLLQENHHHNFSPFCEIIISHKSLSTC